MTAAADSAPPGFEELLEEHCASIGALTRHLRAVILSARPELTEARVVVSGRREGPGQEVVKEIERAGGEALFVRADVAKADEVEAMVRKAVEAFGRLDFALNNAGIEQPIAAAADLMHRHDVGADAALRLLRQESMRRRSSIEAVAALVLDGKWLPADARRPPVPPVHDTKRKSTA